MKKMKTRAVLLLIAVFLMSSILANILSGTLFPMIFSARNEEFNALIAGTVCSGIALIIFAILMIMSINELTRPISKLSEATQRIANGDLEVPYFDIKRKDEIGELEQNFNFMISALKKNELMERDFVQNVSHEFKTPLSIISGYAKLFEKGLLTEEEQAQYGQVIADETARLNKMVTNILLLSKLDNQKLRPYFTTFSLDEQLRLTVLQLEPKWREKSIRLDIELPELEIDAGEELISHVWSNLIDNAIKFSSNNGTVSIHAFECVTSIKVEISDEGIGMDSMTAENAFHQFYQGDTSHMTSGNGLGLALVKRIVDLHEGSIFVISHPGIGSTFLVELPKRRGAGDRFQQPLVRLASGHGD